MRKPRGEPVTEVTDFDHVVPDWETLNVPLWLADHQHPGVPVPGKDFIWTIQCAWGDHQATVRQTKGGALKFKCGDPGCVDKDAKDLSTLWPANIETHFSKWYPKEPDQVVPQDPNYKPPVQIKALGYSGDGLCWYQCSSTGHVTGLKPESHQEGSFYGITPFYKYWIHKYGRGETGKVDWRWAARSMIEECQDAGIYDPMNTRGTGIYFDQGRLVVNAGTELIVDGAPEGIFNFKGEYLYESRTSIPRVAPASDAQLRSVYDLIKRFPFVDDGGADVTMGMIICGYLAGLLEWRPHAWVIGPKGSGKTELLKMASELAMPCGGRFHQGATTAPGVVQGLHNSAVSVVLDEQGEVHNVQQNERIQSLVQLARNSSARIKATVAKGGAYGKGSEYITSCSFLFGSIFHSIDQPQDKDRFCFIKLNESVASKEAWPQLQAALRETLTPEFAASIFWRVAQDARGVLAVVKIFVETLARVPANRRRDCDQWGTVLAVAWWVTHPGAIPTTEDIMNGYTASRTSDHFEDENESNFGEIAIKTLLASVPPGERSSIGEAVSECAIRGPRHANSKEYKSEVAQGKEPHEGFLQRYGIRVETNEKGALELRIGKTHDKVKDVMRRIGFPNYVPVLLTYPGAAKIAKSIAFNSVVYSGYIAIPLDGLIERPAPPPEGWTGGVQPRELRADEVARLVPDP